MVYYIKEEEKNSKNAGGKAPKDIEHTCESLGYHSILFPHRVLNNESVSNKVRLFLLSIIQWIRILIKLSKEDYLIYQHPMGAMPLQNKAIKLLNQKGVKTIAFVHDINSQRITDVNTRSKYEKYDKALSEATYIVVHNERMRKVLTEKFSIPLKKMYPLVIFDYYVNHYEHAYKDVFPYSIAIAGNLSPSKAQYIYELCDNNKNITVHLYGVGLDESAIHENVKYHGAFDADELPEIIGNSGVMFGLVWDGPSYRECVGIGRYMTMNNPHKASLYLASGIPVICWFEAAISSFIKENFAGITVSSLENLRNTLEMISYDEYENMKRHAAELGKKIRDGYYSKKVISEIVGS